MRSPGLSMPLVPATAPRAIATARDVRQNRMTAVRRSRTIGRAATFVMALLVVAAAALPPAAG